MNTALQHNSRFEEREGMDGIFCGAGFGNAASAANTAFMLSDTPTLVIGVSGKVEAVNTAFNEMFHADAAQVIGMSTGVLARRIGPALRSVSGKPLPRGWLDERMTAAPGRRMTVRERAGGEILEVFARTAPHGAHTALFFRRNEASCENSRHMSDLLVNAAHEMRSPMASVLGFSELMLGPGVPADDAKDFLTIIHSEADQLRKLVDDLLDLGRIARAEAGTAKLEPVNMTALAGATIMATGPGMPERVRLRLPAKELWVHADAAQLKRLLSNLLDNARKYSPPASRIDLKISTPLIRGVGHMRITVRDSGIGIPQADLAQIATPFYRAGNAAGLAGTGLGLSYIKQFCELLKGGMRIRSRVGAGTIVSALMQCEVLP